MAAACCLMHSATFKKERDNKKMPIEIIHLKHASTDSMLLTPAEEREMSRRWKKIERKWNVKTRDVSVEMTM